MSDRGRAGVFALICGAIALGLVVWSLGGCYHIEDVPPCDPGSLNYPQCIDPTQPAAARDAGADRG